MSKRDVNIGYRVGTLIAGLEGAIEQLKIAGRSSDLLDKDDQIGMRQAVEIVTAVLQRAWGLLP